jgi:acetyltransferase-like isoleucine patch superfamily enzyme
MSLKNLARRGLRRLMTELAICMLDAQGAVAERTLPRFGNRPEHLKIDLPRRILNPEKIFFGDHVWLGPGCFIAAVKEYPSVSLRHPDKHHDAQTFSPQIHIGHRVTSSGNLVIGGVHQIDIGDDVMFAFNVTILDNLHGFAHPYEPYKYQPLQRIAPVQIGRGCWIGQNAVILPAVKIGEMSIIGANSVVTHDIPERSIALGAPARVVKQWDDTSREWRPYPARSLRANLR